ncbi:hypothetical protein [Neorhodopirellula lusitana]|uniref:hypothetical protein n=1 Tax=Neorhodopirellula lusitana TaxID=445327 RepID=UPI00384B97F4
MTRQFIAIATTLTLLLAGTSHADTAATEDATTVVSVFDLGKLVVPAKFKKAVAKSRIIQHEFAVQEGEGDDAPTARLTMMPAGGGVDANISRWKGQFSGDNKKAGKTEASDSGTWKVHTVKVSGQYTETMGGGPFSGGRKVKRDDYAMLGAILVEPKGRQYFVKMIGPASVIEANEKAFKEMVKNVGN